MLLVNLVAPKQTIIMKENLQKQMEALIDVAFTQLESLRLKKSEGKLYPNLTTGKLNANYPVHINTLHTDPKASYYIFNKNDSNCTKIYNAVSGQFIRFSVTEDLYLYSEEMKQRAGEGFLHRLVMYTPKKRFNSGMTVDHLNSIKADNRKSNLEIVTSSVNSKRSSPQYMLMDELGETFTGCYVDSLRHMFGGFLSNDGKCASVKCILANRFKLAIEDYKITGEQQQIRDYNFTLKEITNTKEDRLALFTEENYLNSLLWSTKTTPPKKITQE